MELLAIVGIVVAAVVGFLFGKKNSSGEAEKNRLEQQLKVKTSELEAFHSKVNTHFEKTAELFNHVSDSYQSLYDHMAKSSNQLCASQTFQVLPKNSSAKIETNAEPLLKQENNNIKSSDSVFNPDQLYQAHEYRNQAEKDDEQQDEDKVNPAEDNNVIKIATAKEEHDAQALDYAIKAKGVINHNSLDNESIKNS